MSQHLATVRWEHDGQDFLKQKYSRAHQWEFDGGTVVQASSSPDVVPLPYSTAENIDPEEALVAAVSSCHMLFFLSFAARAGYVVQSYTDQACGHMEKGDDGRIWMSHIQLQPEIVFAPQNQPSDAQLSELHVLSHQHCFIANSLKTKVEIRS